MSDLDQIAQLADGLQYDPLGWGTADPEMPELLKTWRIENKGQAAWAMEKLAGYARSQAENDAIADERLTRLQQQIQEVRDSNRSENDKLQGSIDYFAGQLQAWHMNQVT